MAPKKPSKQWQIKESDTVDSVDGSIATLMELASVRRAVAQYKEREGTLTERVKDWFLLGGRTVGMARNKVVVTCRPTATFQERQFAEERPDLFEAYTVEVTVRKFDREAFAKQHPDLYREYCSRQLKLNDSVLAELYAAQLAGQTAAQAPAMNPTTDPAWMHR